MTKREIAQLRELINLLQMNTCQFEAPEEYSAIGERHERNDLFTASVREKTRVWRQAWILPVLNNLILKYDKE